MCVRINCIARQKHLLILDSFLIDQERKNMKIIVKFINCIKAILEFIVDLLSLLSKVLKAICNYLT